MSEREFEPPQSYLSRRRFLQTIGMAGMAGLSAPLLMASAENAKAEETRDLTLGIRHIIVACQENHSLDHYYGHYSGIGHYGIPPGWMDHIKPYHFQTLQPPDPNHDWNHIHTEWDGGNMNGFYKANGKNSLGYYLRPDLPDYYSLLPKFTLCVNYFSGVLSCTCPNRLVLFSGTCGGCTTNNVHNGQLDYPCVADLLQEHGVSFKNYNCHCANGHTKIELFKKWNGNRDLNQTQEQFFSDCQHGTLPQVSLRGFDAIQLRAWISIRRQRNYRLKIVRPTEGRSVQES